MSELALPFDQPEIVPPMSESEARDSVQKINACLSDARKLLLDLYEREGWRSLGYSSWRECVVAEFQQSQAYLYRQLEAAQIERNVSPMGEIGEIPERQLRPIAALDEPDDQRAAWDRAQEKAGTNGRITARIVKDAVEEIREEQKAPEPLPKVTLADRTQFIPLPALEHAGVVPLVAHPMNPPRPSFNRTNDNVEWALWTWNPVTGCLHDCNYCYARDIANRFYPQGFVPTFHPERLGAPRFMQVPEAAAENIGEKNVFVCSMADLFGKWVPREWIDRVLEEVIDAPQWNFLFLTKFPQRLCEFEWPANAWVGTTVDRQYRVDIAEKAFRKVTAGVKWLSCEPMLEPLEFGSLDMFDWVVVGGASRSSQTEEFQPEREWVTHLHHAALKAGCKWYEKPNLRPARVREYPGAHV